MNYAFSSTPINTSPYRQYLESLTPGMREEYNFYPDEAYNQWLRSMNLSQSQERNLRQMQSYFYSLFGAQPVTKGYSDRGGYKDWVDYLTSINVNRELARLTPDARGEDSRPYYGRTRWVTFG